MTAPGSRALLTGGTGFLGRHVLAELEARGVQTWSLGRRKPASVPIERHLDLPDPRDGYAMRAAMERAQPEIVLHLAGAAIGSLDEMYVVNAVFAANLLPPQLLPLRLRECSSPGRQQNMARWPSATCP